MIPRSYFFQLLLAIQPWTRLVSAAPAVSISMQASFLESPYILELVETAASENSTAYFPLLDRIAAGHFVSASTDKELYDSVLAALIEDGHVSSSEALSSFKFALALRSAAPRVQAHYQYYATAVAPRAGGDSTAGCHTWVASGGKKRCEPSLDRASDVASTLVYKSLTFDRVLGSGETVVLYTDLVSPQFAVFHKLLAEKARRNEISYHVRYRRPSSPSMSYLPISGYGVELALKRTDYIVIDDRGSAAASSPAPETDPIQAVLKADADDFIDIKPLSSSELASLGLKTCSFILQSDDALDTLVRLTQDLPKFTSSIAANDDVDANFLREHRENRALLAPSGVNVLWLNGLQLIERQVEPFSLVEMLRRERKLIADVVALGLSGKEAVELLSHRAISSAKPKGVRQWRFDWRDEQEDGRAIMWLNDLETDAIYSGYPTELSSLLQRTFPGQIPPIRRNIWNLVVPVDYSKLEDIEIVLQLWMFVMRGLPLRFGLVALTPDENAAKQAKVVSYITKTYGIEAAVSYLEHSRARDHTQPDEIMFNAAAEGREPQPDAVVLTLARVLESEESEWQLRSGNDWAKRLNANTTPPPVFINGVPVPRAGDWIQGMSSILTEDLRTVQQAVHSGSLAEDTDIPAMLLESAVSRRSGYVFLEGGKAPKMLNINKLYHEHASLLESGLVAPSGPGAPKESWIALTVVADLRTNDGLRLLHAALKARGRDGIGIRLDVVDNPGAVGLSGTTPCPVATLKSHQDRLFELNLVDLDSLIMSSSSEPAPDGYATALASFLAATSIRPGDNGLILNGRLVGPIATGDVLGEDDVRQLIKFEQSERILPVLAAADDLGLADRLGDPLAAARLTSIAALSSISDLPEDIFEAASPQRTTAHSVLNSTYSAIEVGDPATAVIHLVALLNPVSEQGQRWAPILKVLSELDGVHVKIFLNPDDYLKELPVKRFFRSVLEAAPSFDESGRVRPPKAVFRGLPSETLLTAVMDVPPAWLVAPENSIHDLDNIKLGSVRADIEAVYKLESILIEGHSREGRGIPPRGAQLVLGTESDPHLTDTIVMANLGFFQFKADPGFYTISLKTGRSADIFHMESVGSRGWQPVPGDEGTDVALTTFQGTTLYPRLQRRRGKEEADVLGDPSDSDTGSVLSRGIKFAEGLLGTGRRRRRSASDEAHAEINIFSVASGHLYERMLNIMMVSVMRHTKHSVKFWFIEQFLSPSFKEFIPHLAAEYGFRYEMVAYKWPHWLRAQKEKQREIWGYKILFLDVLFPLSLDKVIFVDADQIVRTDMIELVDLDLEGAPYGFAPMCDSRTEMEGFRFWKQGYWANYLRGLPYHISALYVVDLGRFRALAAGDRLRQQYQALSADPASLSNLDQDLPNHMQFQIPIRSLPQEWLWCETWCSDESLAEAKTIDLCNNPLTKEPKLERARRQVPEWTVYDEEIAGLNRRRRLETGGSAAAEEGEPAVERNTKSRRLDAVPDSVTEAEAEPSRVKDEL